VQDSPADGLPSEGEVQIPAQPLSAHIATLGTVIAAQTTDVQRPAESQFGAARQASTERSLGEVSTGLVQQPVQCSVAKVSKVSLIASQHYSRPPLVQQTSAENGLSTGSYMVFQRVRCNWQHLLIS